MGRLMKSGICYTGTGGGSITYTEITLAEYEELTYDQKHNGELYFITDVDGSGGDGYTRAILWDYTVDNNNAVLFGMYNATLHYSIDDYDFLIVEIISSESDLSDATWNASYQFIVDISDLKVGYNNNYVAYSSYGTRASKFHISGTSFEKAVGDSNTHGLVRIYGIKFGSNTSGAVELTDTLTAGETELVFTENSITADSTVDVYTDTYGINPTNVVVATGTITLTFEAQSADLGVKVRIW